MTRIWLALRFSTLSGRRGYESSFVEPFLARSRSLNVPDNDRPLEGAPGTGVRIVERQSRRNKTAAPEQHDRVDLPVVHDFVGVALQVGNAGQQVNHVGRADVTPAEI